MAHAPIVYVKPLNDHLAEEIIFQRAMLRDITLASGTPLQAKLWEIFDHYARTMLAIHVVHLRAAGTPMPQDNPAGW